MTKDDLIEALDKALMREDADCEDDAGACADAVVEFVAGWLGRWANSEAMVEQWREEMA